MSCRWGFGPLLLTAALFGVAVNSPVLAEGNEGLTFGAAIIDSQGRSSVVFADKLAAGPKEGVMVMPSAQGAEPNRVAVIVGPSHRVKDNEAIPRILWPHSILAQTVNTVILPPHGDIVGVGAVGVVVVRKGPPLGVGEDSLSYRLCSSDKGPVVEVHAPGQGGGELLWSAQFPSSLSIEMDFPPCD